MNTSNILPDLSVTTTLSGAIDIDIEKYFELDRYLGESLQLPYTFDDLKIKPNELCVADNINACFDKLHHNFLYINAQTKIASNNFPLSGNYKGYFATASATSDPHREVRWFKAPIDDSSRRAHKEFVGGTDLVSNLSAEAIANQSYGKGPTPLDSFLHPNGLIDGVFADNLRNSNYYMGFIANSANLMAIQSDKDDTFIWGPQTILNTPYVENSTQLTFTNIKSLAMNSQNRLFVLDDVNIFKFDVDTLLAYNPALSGIGRDLMFSIGGKSDSVNDKLKFNIPVSIAIGKHDKVYVLDQKDKAYKVYDKDLNWIKTVIKTVDFAQDTVVDIAVDKDNEDVYVLTENGILFRYNNDNELVQQQQLVDILAKPYIDVPSLSSITVDVLGLPADKFTGIAFSRNDGNVLYVLTEKNIFKKFKTKTDRSIGSFRLTDNNIYTLSGGYGNIPVTEEKFKFINLLNTSDRSKDYIFVGGNSSGNFSVSSVGKVFKFEESVTYQSCIYDSYKTRTYQISAVHVHPDEYVTSWVLNKSLYKLIYNHLLLRDNFHSKFVGEYNEAGLVQYKGIEYITDLDDNLFGYETTLNNFIGINEPILAETINRCIGEVYTIQQGLVKMCGERIANKYPYATQVVRLQ